MLLSAQMDTLKSSTHIFWSSEYKIQMTDFHNTVKSGKFKTYCEEYNICWGAVTGLYSVLDHPKKKKDRRKKEEKIYFAPAFELNTSYRFNSDSTEYLQQALVFDMYEWAARRCRLELDSMYVMSPSIGIKAIMFKTIESDVLRRLNTMVSLFTNEVYVQAISGAYEKWRKIVDELLESAEKYQTTALDRLRFIKNEPVDQGYIKAKKIIDVIEKK